MTLTLNKAGFITLLSIWDTWLILFHCFFLVNVWSVTDLYTHGAFISTDSAAADLRQRGFPEPALGQTWPNLSSLEAAGAVLSQA